MTSRDSPKERRKIDCMHLVGSKKNGYSRANTPMKQEPAGESKGEAATELPEPPGIVIEAEGLT